MIHLLLNYGAFQDQHTLCGLLVSWTDPNPPRFAHFGQETCPECHRLAVERTQTDA